MGFAIDSAVAGMESAWQFSSCKIVKSIIKRAAENLQRILRSKFFILYENICFKLVKLDLFKSIL